MNQAWRTDADINRNTASDRSGATSGQDSWPAPAALVFGLAGIFFATVMVTSWLLHLTGINEHGLLERHQRPLPTVRRPDPVVPVAETLEKVVNQAVKPIETHPVEAPVMTEVDLSNRVVAPTPHASVAAFGHSANSR